MRRSWSAGDVPPAARPTLKKSSKPRHFKSIGILGRGGFGLVILAAHKASKAPVVLKICTSTTSKAYMVASRERELLGRLNHRHIVSKLNAYVDVVSLFLSQTHTHTHTHNAYHSTQIREERNERNHTRFRISSRW